MDFVTTIKVLFAILGIIEIISGIIVIALATSVSKKNRQENDEAYLKYIREQKDKTNNE